MGRLVVVFTHNVDITYLNMLLHTISPPMGSSRALWHRPCLSIIMLSEFSCRLSSFEIPERCPLPGWI